MLNSSKSHRIILFILWVAVHALLFYRFGLRDLYDSKIYINGADGLIAHGTFDDFHYFFYAIPVAAIATSRSLFSGALLPYILFQCVLSGFAVIALYRTAAKAIGDPRAGLFAALVFLLWWDNIQWNTAVMTESIFCSVICFLLWQLVQFDGSRRRYVIVAILIVILFFIRPTSVVIILGVMAFLLRYHWDYFRGSALRKGVLIVSFGVIASLSASLMFMNWDFTDQYKRGNLITYVDTTEGTSLYSESLQMDASSLEFAEEDNIPIVKVLYFITHNPIYVIKSGSFKIVYLLSGVRPYYSWKHNVYLLMWMTLVYTLCYFGWRSFRGTPILYFILTVVVVNAALIGISTVDWDNRFYIPMEPGIVVLAGFGSGGLLNRITRKPSARAY